MDLSFAVLSSLEVDVTNPWPDWFGRHPRMIESGVASEGDPSAYALVWEFGNLRQYKKGPRTILGTSPAGGREWLSTQAPQGWIAINEPRMWAIIDDHMAKFTLGGNTEFGMTVELEQMSLDISRDILTLLKSTAPVDTDALDLSLTIVEPGDSLLDVVEDSFAEMDEGTTDSGVLLIDRNYDSPLNG